MASKFRQLMACDQCGALRLVIGQSASVDDKTLETPCLAIRREHPQCPGIVRYVGEVLFISQP